MIGKERRRVGDGRGWEGMGGDGREKGRGKAVVDTRNTLEEKCDKGSFKLTVEGWITT